MTLDTAKVVAVSRSVTAKFDAGARGATPFYPRLCTRAPSQGNDEQYGWLGSFPGMREWLGDRIYEELRAAHFTLENKLWESTLKIERKDIDDDRLGMYAINAQQLGVEAAHHPDKLLVQAIVAGSSTACFDGQYFFDTDHSWGSSGTQANFQTYNAADHTAVTAAEFRAAYHAARRAMVEFVNDRGEPLIRPIITRFSDLVCFVPAELELAAYEALTATILGNNSNVVLDQPEIVGCPYLTDAASFYLFNTGGILRPFVFQEREPLRRQTKYADDIEWKHMLFLTEARYNVGYLGWWNAVKVTFN